MEKTDHLLEPDQRVGRNPLRLIALISAPLVALVMILMEPPGELPLAAWRTSACLVWMAIWWMTEILPVSVTALLPILLFPILGVADIKSTATSYAHPIIYLFMGGFLLALAIEKWNLHRRVALGILLSVGGNARALMAGFMATAALLSMWISNTATSIMLLPIGLAIITVVGHTVTDLTEQEKKNFSTALMLSIAYAATIGGVATLIGTPPNAFMAGFLIENYNIEISFVRWMAVGLPVTLVMLPIAWWLLVKFLFPFDFRTSPQTKETLLKIRSELGPMTREEKIISGVFVVTALAWMFRPILDNYFIGLSDPGIALFSGLAMFVIPSSKGDGQLLAWPDTAKMPWGILVLFGGGLALASAVSQSGLALAIGSVVVGLEGVEIAFLVVIIATVVIFLTELTSNLATTATFLPVIGATALQFGIDPQVFLVPVALAASCAFMLPVATPPNAIVYSSGRITIRQMARAGLALNVCSIVIVSTVSVVIVPIILVSIT